MVRRMLVMGLGLTGLVLLALFANPLGALLGLSADFTGGLRRFSLALAIFLGAHFSYELIRAHLQRQRKGARAVPKVTLDLLRVTLFVAALLASLSLFLHRDLSGFLTGSGLVLAVLGFAIRNVVADTFSGLALGLEAPFRIGDWVNIEGLAQGRIQEIGWRTTRLVTRDSTYVILPNSQISRQRITNYSAPKKEYRDSAELTLPITLPVSEAKALMRGALARVDSVLPSRGSDVQVAQYGPLGVTYRITYFVPQFDQERACRNEVISRIDAELRLAGVSLRPVER